MTTSVRDRDAFVTIYILNSRCTVDIRAADLSGTGALGPSGDKPPDQAYRFLAQLACPNVADLKGRSTKLGFTPATFPLSQTPLLKMLIMGPTDIIVATLLCDMGQATLPANLLSTVMTITWSA